MEDARLFIKKVCPRMCVKSMRVNKSFTDHLGSKLEFPISPSYRVSPED